MERTGLVGWRGMVGSVLLERMAAHGVPGELSGANKYLVDTNRTVVITMPKAKAKPATGASGQ